jgi:GNAT superfamily N-acetyltransferase
VPTPKLRYSIEPLQGRRHARAAFTCGRPELDDYLRNRATQDLERNAAAVFVALPTASADVAGYYSLSALSVPLTDLPATVARKLPRYPNLPATLLGRLAVDRGHQGRGVGIFLLLDALARAWRATGEVGSVAVVVDAIDEAARRFYEHCEFIPLPDQRLRLFLPMKSIARIVG